LHLAPARFLFFKLADTAVAYYNEDTMIIFLYGKDTFRSRQQLKKMIEKFCADRDPQGLNTARLDAEKEKGGQILEQTLAQPFLAEKRMVVIENLLVSKQVDVRAEFLKRIEEKRLPENNVIVFWEGTDKFKTKDAKAFFSRLLQEKYTQYFELFLGAKLEAWISTECDARDGLIGRDVAGYLAKHVGEDMWRLSSLIDQLVAFADGKEVTLPDVQLFLDEKHDDNIFNLIDAIVGKQSKHVFAMIEEQYRNGKDAGYIFAMILRQFRILLELRDIFEREDEPRSDELAKRLGLHPFVVKKSLPLVRRYSFSEIEDIYQRLLSIDIDTKTGQGNQAMLIDVFVGRVCAVS
jgi:DNA polymerase-3 subunit delta